MKWKRWIIVGMMFSLAACGGGETEQEETSCSVEELDDGRVRIDCPDGTTATIAAPSADDAASCDFQESNGELRVTCDDGTDLVIRDGVDGTSGSACSVDENSDGTATISCDDGTSATIGTPTPDTGPDFTALELLAGVTSVGTDDGVGTATRMNGALDGVYDPSGEFLYFVDSFNMTIRRFSLLTQQVVTLAGQAGIKGASDGVGFDATFEGPRGIAIHPDGDRLFIADGFNCTIREMDLNTNEVTTLTGQAGECDAVDGSLEDARLRLTIGMVMESSGRYIYLSDRGNDAIRRIDLEDQVLETIAGELGDWGHADGVGADARFDGPGGIDLSEDESILYINDTFNNVIRALIVAVDEDDDETNLFEVSTIAGSPGQGGNVDGVGADARFQVSQGLARADDALFVAGFHNSIRRIDLDTWEVSTVAGQSGVSGSVDGPYFDARFGVSFGILAHPDGRRVYYMDRGNNNIRLYDRLTREVTTVMGAPEPTVWRDGPTGTSRMNSPRAVVANQDGSRLFVADQLNHVIRSFDTETGTLSTIAGLPGRSGFIDGLADEARFFRPEGLWLDSDETYLYVADAWNDSIRRVNVVTSQVTTVVGRPLAAGEGSTDGDLESALLDWPFGIAGHETPDGLVLFVTDHWSGLVRRVDLNTDEVTTIAGGGEVDPDEPWVIDGTGADAVFNRPTGLAIASDGETLYVADQSHQVIRRIDLDTNEVETFVGDVGVRDSFDGVGDDATFDFPSHIALVDDDRLLVADRWNYSIRHVDIPAASVTTIVGELGVVGGGSAQFTPLDEARMYFTNGVTVAGEDLILTADQALLRVVGIFGDE